MCCLPMDLQAAAPVTAGAPNPWVDFRGQRRDNTTHRSVIDPEARLYTKTTGVAHLQHSIHVLMENRHGIGVDIRAGEGRRQRRTRVLSEDARQGETESGNRAGDAGHRQRQSQKRRSDDATASATMQNPIVSDCGSPRGQFRTHGGVDAVPFHRGRWPCAAHSGHVRTATNRLNGPDWIRTNDLTLIRGAL